MRQSASIDGCPFAQPGPPVSETGAGFYCLLPNGRVHVPTPDAIRRFYASGRLTECPVNQRWMAVIQAEPRRHYLKR